MKSSHFLTIAWITATLLASLLFSTGSSKEGDPIDISWTAVIEPGGKGISMTGIVPNARTSDVKKWTAGMISSGPLSVVKSEKDLVFRYTAPVDQAVFTKPLNPLLNDKQFCGFGRHLLVFPELKERTFKRFSLTIQHPEGWTLATSLGTYSAPLIFDNPDDLRGLMICAGEYAVKEFELPNKNRKDPTRYVLMLHGERTFDDEEYFATMKKLFQAQLDYFGGDHPAPVQAVALHVVGQGVRPTIPGFNRRVPSFDSILGVHDTSRPWGSFEFFGMLSHEHMHNWFPNVLPCDLDPWFMEGLNDYVSYKIMHDSELHSTEQFSGMLNKWYREYQWCVLQKGNPLIPYRQGMIAAWVMDLEIQRATDKKKSLKNLIEHLLENTPKDQAVTRNEFVAALGTLVGENAEDLYVSLVESEKAISLAEYFEGSRYSIVDGKILIAD